jgi:hypothetical protein
MSGREGRLDPAGASGFAVGTADLVVDVTGWWR